MKKYIIQKIQSLADLITDKTLKSKFLKAAAELKYASDDRVNEILNRHFSNE